jgi:DNA polymerase III delta subunit
LVAQAGGRNSLIYFIHGPDRLLAREAAQAITFELDPDGANTSSLDGRETTPDRVIAAIGTVSFFGGARVVVVSDLLGRSGRDTVTDDSSKNDQDRLPKSQPWIASLVAAVPDEHCLIFIEPAMTSVPAALKSAAPGLKIIAADPPRGAALVAWIEAAASRAGTHIDRRVAQLIAETLFPQTWDRKPNNPRYDRPPDMALLTQEIDKLAMAAHPGSITADLVRSLVPGGPDQRVFRFLDAAVNGDLRAATGEMERLAAAGEEPAMLLAQTLGQIELAVIARAAGTRDAATVSRDMGSIAASRLSAVMASTRRRSSGARSPVETGVLADRRLKTGKVRRPEDALHDLMLALAEDAPSDRNTGRSK